MVLTFVCPIFGDRRRSHVGFTVGDSSDSRNRSESEVLFSHNYSMKQIPKCVMGKNYGLCALRVPYQILSVMSVSLARKFSINLHRSEIVSVVSYVRQRSLNSFMFYILLIAIG